MEVLTWAAKGKTYWETAAILGISYASVHSHINSLKSKMNAVNVAHAVARGYELGILELRTAEPRVMMAVTLTGQRPDASRQIVASENLPVFSFRSSSLLVGPGVASSPLKPVSRE